MGDDLGPKVGGDRVAVGVVDGMRYHVSLSGERSEAKRECRVGREGMMV